MHDANGQTGTELRCSPVQCLDEAVIVVSDVCTNLNSLLPFAGMALSTTSSHTAGRTTGVTARHRDDSLIKPNIG